MEISDGERRSARGDGNGGVECRVCQGRPQLASPLTMTKGFEVLDGVKADLSI